MRNRNTYRMLAAREPTGCCPSCGQTMPEAGLRVDLQTNTVSANGLVIAVQARQAEMIELLRRGFPNFIPRERIIDRVFANNVLDRSVDVHASRARVLLKKIGWGIESIRHEGYRLHELGAVEEPTVVPNLGSFTRFPGYWTRLQKKRVQASRSVLAGKHDGDDRLGVVAGVAERLEGDESVGAPA